MTHVAKSRSGVEMVGSGQQHAHKLQCGQRDSVLEAIEASWAEHHAGKSGFSLGLYASLALLLNQDGFVIDTVDGLDILEHCRRRGLPIVDVLRAIEDRVRQAGYHGERLSLADFNVGGKPVYAFYDGARIRTFVELKQKTQMRIAVTTPVELRPDA